MGQPPKPDTAWHLDRRVPLALIMTIVIQTAALVWWAAGIDRKVAENNRRIVQLEDGGGRANVASQVMSERLVRLEERLIAVSATLSRIERAVERNP